MWSASFCGQFATALSRPLKNFKKQKLTRPEDKTLNLQESPSWMPEKGKNAFI